MAVEGFALIDSVSITLSSATNAFVSDITFTDTPDNVVRSIQIQIYAASSSILSVRYNGVNYPINNSVAVAGTIVFTTLVTKNDTINIQTDGTSIPLVIIVAGA